MGDYDKQQSGCVRGCLGKLLGNTPLGIFLLAMLDPANAEATKKMVQDNQPAGLSPYEKNKARFYQRHAQEQASESAPCPSCRRQMRASDWHGIALHDCDKCRGLWVDETRLGELFRADPPESLINPKIRRTAFYKTEPGRRKCPKCRQTLDCKDIVDVPIERCAHCKGAWLDHGEFHRLRAVWLEDPATTVELIPKCSYCDLENLAEARRCEACGAPLSRRQL